MDGGGPGSLGGLVSRAFLVLAVDRRGGRDARRDRGVRRAILADVARGEAARVGARSGERTSGGGFAHAFPASGVETTSAWATVTPPPLLGCRASSSSSAAAAGSA